jgi:hypothetical protein
MRALVACMDRYWSLTVVWPVPVVCPRWLVGLNFNPRIKVVPLIEVKTQDLFWNRAYHQEWSRKDMKERIVEERNTKYGKRIVKQIEGKIIIQKIREDKTKEDKKKSKRKKGKK